MCACTALTAVAVKMYGKAGYRALLSFPAAVLLWAGIIAAVLIRACVHGYCP